MTYTRATVRKWAWATLVVAVIVVLWGSVVRATFSGAGCGDHWPLCNGQVIPSFIKLNTRIEFTHRMMTVVWTGMTILVAIGTFLRTPKRHPARKASIASLVLLVTEALLGAALVLRHDVESNTSLERVIMQAIHFTNTMLLLAAVTLNAAFLRDRVEPIHSRIGAHIAAWTAMICTIIAGATGSLAALADTLWPSTSIQQAIVADFAASSPLLIRMRWIHPASAILLTIAVLYLMRGRARFLLGINLAVQMAIGIADVLLLAPTWIQVIHLLGADIFWISLLTVCASAFLSQQELRANEKAAQ